RAARVQLGGARRAETLLQVAAESERAAHPAGDVVADVDDRPGARLKREHVVERRNAVRFGGRDHQTLADIVERALADPADAPLDGMQRWQEKMATSVGLVVAAVGDLGLGARAPCRALPTRGGGAERRVDGGALLGRGDRAWDEVKIHSPPPDAGRR